MTTRRDILAAMGAMVALLLPGQTLEAAEVEETLPQYGLIGQILAQPGRRADLAAMLKAMDPMNLPGNFGYLVGEDRENADALWVVEIWETQEHHAASLRLPHVQDAIAQGRPLIAGFGARHEFRPA